MIAYLLNLSYQQQIKWSSSGTYLIQYLNSLWCNICKILCDKSCSLLFLEYSCGKWNILGIWRIKSTYPFRFDYHFKKWFGPNWKDNFLYSYVLNKIYHLHLYDKYVYLKVSTQNLLDVAFPCIYCISYQLI